MTGFITGPYESTEGGEQQGVDFDYGYGFPPHGTDPRDFSPDMELCSSEEIAHWEEDKAKAEAGEDGSAPPPGFWAGNMHVLAPRWGIGTYKFYYDDDEEGEDGEQ